ncbi:TMV resistance protein N-like [Cornus florida]|uniref:TMV resistance protein N-like n=1 Tax=Cornus florida TaxID=4283 RepID=UPI00289DB011|nr:TMV resistance protein N-like [Cornus florida]
MPRLRLLQLNNARLRGDYEEFPRKLRWLCWHGFPLDSIPSGLHLESLVALDMRNSSLKQAWNGNKLEKFPTELGQMESLKMLLADGIGINQSPSMTTGVRSWPSYFRDWLLGPRRSPESISFSLCSLPRSLSVLGLAGCNLSDGAIPKDIGSLSLLQRLDLRNNPICILPESVKFLTMLRSLSLDNCTTLQLLPELPMSLRSLDLFECRSLEMITNLPNLLDSLYLYITDCDKLTEVQGLFNPLETFMKY